MTIVTLQSKKGKGQQGKRKGKDKGTKRATAAATADGNAGTELPVPGGATGASGAAAPGLMRNGHKKGRRGTSNGSIAVYCMFPKRLQCSHNGDRHTSRRKKMCSWFNQYIVGHWSMSMPASQAGERGLARLTRC